MNLNRRFITCLLYVLGMLAPVPAVGEKHDAIRSAGFPRLDVSTLPISHKIEIGGDPDWLAIGFGSVWIAVPKSNEVVRVDPVRNTVQARVPVDKEPCYGIGVGAKRVWVLNCQGQTLTGIDPRTNKVTLRVAVKIDTSGEGSIVAEPHSVWFISNEDGHSSMLTQADSQTGRTRKTIRVGIDSAVVRSGFGSVWAVSSGESKVYRVNPVSGRVIARIQLASTPRFTTVGAGSIWVLSQSDGSVARINPNTNRVTAVIAAQVPGAGGEICYGGGFIWVTMNGTPVTRIDPVRNKVVDQYGNYKGADAIRYGFGSIWVSDHGKGDLWRIDAAKLRSAPRK